MSEVLSSVEVSMKSATHGVWLDQDLLAGDGLIVCIAPQVFQMGRDGLEYVRFGSVMGFRGGSEAVVPIVPELMDKVIEAAEEHPAEMVFVEELGQPAEKAWDEFFRGAITWARQRTHYHLGRSLDEPLSGFYSGQRSMPATQTLLTSAAIIDPDPMNDAKYETLYSPHLHVGSATVYDDLDVLTYVGARGADDIVTRREVSRSLYSLALSERFRTLTQNLTSREEMQEACTLEIERPELAKAAMHFLSVDQSRL